MSANRSRKEDSSYKQYRRRKSPHTCDFCNIETGDIQHIETTNHFKIISNIFPYSIWDGQAVIDHLMVIPKNHVDSLAGMSDKQKIEYVDILDRFESNGYNIYARAPASLAKSVPHQHTHLIKTKGSTKRFLFLLRKPYIRLSK